jgi:hypothetical protein
MPEELKYAWQEYYQRAILEFDPRKKAERIAVAETIIGARRQALIGNPSASDEREALQDALKGLRILRRNHT